MVPTAFFLIFGLIIHVTPSFTAENSLQPFNSPFTPSVFFQDQDDKELRSLLVHNPDNDSQAQAPQIQQPPRNPSSFVFHSDSEQSEISSDESDKEDEEGSDYEYSSSEERFFPAITNTARIEQLEEQMHTLSSALVVILTTLKTLTSSHKLCLDELKHIRNELAQLAFAPEFFACQTKLFESFKGKFPNLYEEQSSGNTGPHASSSSSSHTRFTHAPSRSAKVYPAALRYYISDSASDNDSDNDSNLDDTDFDSSYSDINDCDISDEDQTENESSSSAVKPWGLFHEEIRKSKPSEVLEKLNVYITHLENNRHSNRQWLHQAYAKKASLFLNLYKLKECDEGSVQKCFSDVTIDLLHPAVKKCFLHDLDIFEKMKNPRNKRQRAASEEENDSNIDQSDSAHTDEDDSRLKANRTWKNLYDRMRRATPKKGRELFQNYVNTLDPEDLDSLNRAYLGNTGILLTLYDQGKCTKKQLEDCFLMIKQGDLKTKAIGVYRRHKESLEERGLRTTKRQRTR